MRAILLFYMYYAVTKGGLGMSQTTAASIMSIYGSLVYLSTLVGGWLSDRVWGSRKTVFYGGVLIMLGHIVLALPAGVTVLYRSIALIVVGTGLLKPNVSDMVGGLYSVEDPRRDAGFSIFVFGINLGSIIAPWLVPWAAQGFGVHIFGSQLNFHAGFSLAAVGMFFGLVQYVLGGKKYLSTESLTPNDPIDKGDLLNVIKWVVIIIIAIVAILAAMAGVGQLSVDNVITLLTILAIALPIYYFVMMFRSSKVTKIELGIHLLPVSLKNRLFFKKGYKRLKQIIQLELAIKRQSFIILIALIIMASILIPNKVIIAKHLLKLVLLVFYWIGLNLIPFSTFVLSFLFLDYIKHMFKKEGEQAKKTKEKSRIHHGIEIPLFLRQLIINIFTLIILEGETLFDENGVEVNIAEHPVQGYTELNINLLNKDSIDLWADWIQSVAKYLLNIMYTADVIVIIIFYLVKMAALWWAWSYIPLSTVFVGYKYSGKDESLQAALEVL
uniref:Di-/tripeptide transporter n=1 Tax=Lactobacillus helveticus TaxID=1587 RepID=DTPT_LACHE|nr:RecName: Full=Di-/tripeptide transporter [Lactobacillus helveticus]AAC45382.1 di-/tripeptide transporter [Lactobacillus helveticus]